MSFNPFGRSNPPKPRAERRAEDKKARAEARKFDRDKLYATFGLPPGAARASSPPAMCGAFVIADMDASKRAALALDDQRHIGRVLDPQVELGGGVEGLVQIMPAQDFQDGGLHQVHGALLFQV